MTVAWLPLILAGGFVALVAAVAIARAVLAHARARRRDENPPDDEDAGW